MIIDFFGDADFWEELPPIDPCPTLTGESASLGSIGRSLLWTIPCVDKGFVSIDSMAEPRSCTAAR